MAMLKDSAKAPTKAKKPKPSAKPPIFQSPTAAPWRSPSPLKPPATPKGLFQSPNATPWRTPSPLMPPATPAPAPAPAGSSGAAQNLGSSYTGTIGAMTPEPLPPELPPAKPAMTDAEFLAQDNEFLDTSASLDSELANLKAQLSRERGDYELDINNSKRNMGSLEGGGWNTKDKLTGYGNAFNNQQNDFASRGMLDSSLYGGALDDLNRGFQTQRSDLDQALSQFTGGQSEQLTQAGSAKDAAILAARRQALARMAASLNLGG